MDWMQMLGLALGGVLAVVIRSWLWPDDEGSRESAPQDTALALVPNQFVAEVDHVPASLGGEFLDEIIPPASGQGSEQSKCAHHGSGKIELIGTYRRPAEGGWQ